MEETEPADEVVLLDEADMSESVRARLPLALRCFSLREEVRHRLSKDEQVMMTYYPWRSPWRVHFHLPPPVFRVKVTGLVSMTDLISWLGILKDVVGC